MHAKPRLRVLLKWMITASGSVITDVIPLKLMRKDGKTIHAILESTVIHILGMWLGLLRLFCLVRKAREKES